MKPQCQADKTFGRRGEMEPVNSAARAVLPEVKAA